MSHRVPICVHAGSCRNHLFSQQSDMVASELEASRVTYHGRFFNAASHLSVRVKNLLASTTRLLVCSLVAAPCGNDLCSCVYAPAFPFGFVELRV